MDNTFVVQLKICDDMNRDTLVENNLKHQLEKLTYKEIKRCI